MSLSLSTMPGGRATRLASQLSWLYAALLLICCIAFWRSSKVLDLLIGWAVPPADVIEIVAIVVVLRVAPPRGYRRMAWILMLVSAAVDLSFGMVYPHYNASVPSLYRAVVDAAFQSYYPFMTAVCVCFYLSCGGSFRHRQVWIDSATVLLGVVAILWGFLYEFPAASGAEVAMTVGTKLFYTAGISITMTATVLLFTQISDDRSDRAAMMIVVGAVVSLITDLLWLGWSTGGVSVLRSIYGAGDLAFTAGDVIFSACITTAAAIELRQRAPDGHRASAGAPTYSFLPALVLLLAIVLLAASEALRNGVDMRVLVGMVVLGAILVVARQRIVSEELRRLNRALAIRELDARLTELVRRSADVIAVVNDAGTVTFASAAAERVLGVPAVSVPGSAATSLLGPGNVTPLSRFIEGLKADPAATTDIELDFAAPNGEQRIVRVAGTDQRASPLIEGITLTLSDITEQRILEREVLDIAAQERLRLSSDIHEGLGQDLTGIALMLQSASASPVDDVETLQASLRGVAGHVNRAIATARELANGLAPLHVEGSLLLALRHLADTVNSRYFFVDVRVDVSGDEGAIADSIADHLYRIAHESVNNAMRHGGGRMIHVALRITAEQVMLEIADDGRGFNAKAGVQQGLGLRMIRYRTRLMRGTLQIDQPPAGGTRIIVSVPYGNS